MRRLAVQFCLALALLALAAPAAPAWAQLETGRISGTVSDTQGGVVPGVTVTAKSVKTGVSRETVSDTEGKYVIANLAPDTYEVSFMLTGFKQVTQKDTVVTVGADIAVNAKLEVGNVTESVTVTAVPEVIDTRTGEFRTTVSERQITELPTLTRNPYDLVALAGNVKEVSPDEITLVGGGGRGTGFSINGQRSSSTNILLDGGDNNYLFVGSLGQEVPLDAVQEFSVVTNNFSAQYGRATGGIVNVVTKSGSNRFSGTGYEFFRNDELAAISPDNKAKELEEGDFRRNQLGYSLGGPIVKDKVHFFSSLEYIRIRSIDNLSSWVVTPQFLAATNPATQAYFATYGAGLSPNGPVLTREGVTTALGIQDGAFNNLPASLPVFQRIDVPIATDAGGGFPGDTYQTINKVDFSLGVNNRASISYAYLKGDNESGTQSASPYPKYNTPTFERKHNVNGSLTRVWANNFTSQSRLVWNKVSEDQPINGAPEPGLYMNTLSAVLLQGDPIAFPGYFPFNPGVSIPAGGPQKLFQVYQDQTWLKGAHDVRFGGAFVRVMDEHEFGAFSNALQALSIAASNTTSLNNLVAGQLGRFQKAINPGAYPGETYVSPVAEPSFLSNNTYNEFAFYANDNWSVGNRLKLNLGVRYEYFGPQQKSDPKYDSNFYWADPDFNLTDATPQETFAQLSGGRVFPSNESPIGSLWRADKDNFAPRLGFAWDVNGDGRAAVRGGYGIAYERNFGNVTYNVLFNPPQYVLATLDNAAAPLIQTDNLGPFGGAAGVTRTVPVAQLRHIDQNIETAYSHLYGVSFTKALTNGLTGSIEYNGSTGRKLYDLADVNRAGAPMAYGELTPPATPCTVNPVQGPCLARPNTQYSSFGTRGNRGQSQYHGVVFSLDSNQIGNTGLALTGKYTLSKAEDNLSSAFGDNDNMRFITGGAYVDPYTPMFDYGYAAFDVRHRLSASFIWSVPFGGDSPWAGGWQVNGLFTARSGYPFSVGDCDNGFFICIRAIDEIGTDRSANDDTPTGEPNEYTLLDLTELAQFAGSYVHPIQGTSDFGPYPDTMTKRNDFRGPGAWNFDLSIGKRFRFGQKAGLVRIEMYNVFNHANMYTNTETAFVTADPSTPSRVTGFLDDFRRVQLGFKFEF